MSNNGTIQIPEPALSRFIFSDTRFAWVWLVLRVYVGWQWFVAGWDKCNSQLWVGEKAGAALHGYLLGALQKTLGQHPDVSGWYAWFLNHLVLPHTVFFSYLVAYGELLVGVCLILGLFTGLAAFFGTFMNVNYLFAGTLSINPLLLLVQLLIILAWRVAGWIGLDRYMLPILGTPWQPGKVFKKN